MEAEAPAAVTVARAAPARRGGAPVRRTGGSRRRGGAGGGIGEIPAPGRPVQSGALPVAARIALGRTARRGRDHRRDPAGSAAHGDPAKAEEPGARSQLDGGAGDRRNRDGAGMRPRLAGCAALRGPRLSRAGQLLRAHPHGDHFRTAGAAGGLPAASGPDHDGRHADRQQRNAGVDSGAGGCRAGRAGAAAEPVQEEWSYPAQEESRGSSREFRSRRTRTNWRCRRRGRAGRRTASNC